MNGGHKQYLILTKLQQALSLCFQYTATRASAEVKLQLCKNLPEIYTFSTFPRTTVHYLGSEVLIESG